MEFLQSGVRRCEITGAEVYEGSVEALKRQGLLHGDFPKSQTFGVVTAWYDPRTTKDTDLYAEESDAIDRICQIAKRSPELDTMCRRCDNFGTVCEGSYTHIYSGCIMQHLSREEFLEYEKAMSSIPKKGESK